MKDKHDADLGMHILIQILEHTCQTSILLPLRSSETIKLPERELHTYKHFIITIKVPFSTYKHVLHLIYQKTDTYIHKHVLYLIYILHTFDLYGNSGG